MKQITSMYTKMFINTNLSLSSSLLRNSKNINALSYSFAT